MASNLTSRISADHACRAAPDQYATPQRGPALLFPRESLFWVGDLAAL
jgi:hypothetical protein